MNINKPIISIIIPVYNNEDFLSQTFDSLLSQTMQDFEVIIVNDGSTDNSLSIINDFCDKFPNSKCINKPNGGVSSARNEGLKHAKGDYISFVDGDDFVKPDFLKNMYDEAIRTDADVVCCNYSFYFMKSGRKLRSFPQLKAGVYSNERMLNCIIRDFHMHYYLWNKLWRRSLFTENDITFPLMCFEDIATSPRLFYHANKVAVISDNLYYYTKHEGSLVSFMNESKFNDYIRSIAIVRNFLQKNNDYKPYKLSLSLYGYRVIITSLKLLPEIHFSRKIFKGMFNNFYKCARNILYYVGNNFECIGSLDDFEDTINLG